MDVSDSLLSLFSARIEQRNGSHVVTIPEQEIELGQVDDGEVYRVGLLEALEPGQNSTGSAQAATSANTRTDPRGQQQRTPPVEEGDIRDVKIEDMGEKGDGIARIGPGYIVFVEGTTVGDQVRIKITEARENFAFGDVIEHV